MKNNLIILISTFLTIQTCAMDECSLPYDQDNHAYKLTAVPANERPFLTFDNITQSLQQTTVFCISELKKLPNNFEYMKNFQNLDNILPREHSHNLLTYIQYLDRRIDENMRYKQGLSGGDYKQLAPYIDAIILNTQEKKRLALTPNLKEITQYLENGYQGIISALCILTVTNNKGHTEGFTPNFIKDINYKIHSAIDLITYYLKTGDFSLTTTLQNTNTVLRDTANQLNNITQQLCQNNVLPLSDINFLTSQEIGSSPTNRNSSKGRKKLLPRLSRKPIKPREKVSTS